MRITHRYVAAFSGVVLEDDARERLRFSAGATASTFADVVAASRACATALRSAYRSRVERGIATSLRTLLASTTEAGKQRRSVSLEEPGARVMREHRVTLAGFAQL